MLIIVYLGIYTSILNSSMIHNNSDHSINLATVVGTLQYNTAHSVESPII